MMKIIEVKVGEEGPNSVLLLLVFQETVSNHYFMSRTPCPISCSQNVHHCNKIGNFNVLGMTGPGIKTGTSRLPLGK